MSASLGRQRRYDLFLAFVPIGLVVTLAASWSFPISLHVAVAAGSVVVGTVLTTFILRHPPSDTGGTEPDEP